MNNKRILSILLSLTMLCSAVCVTGAFSGLTAFGEPTGENIIAGMTAVPVSTTWSDTLNGGGGSGLTEILDAANLTNGADDQTQLLLPGCSDNPGSGDYAHRAGYTKLYFDLGGSYAVSQTDITCFGSSSWRYLYKGSVYLADSPEELFQTGSEIASFDYGYSHTPQKVLSFHSEDATGRYVGFAFYAPGARETGWATTFCGRVNVAELAVYGTPVKAQNVIAGMTAVPVSTTWSDTLNGGGGSGLTEILDVANLTNGADDQTQLLLPGCSDNPGSGDYAHRAGYTKLYFDLGGSYAVSQTDITCYGSSSWRYLYKGSVYLADSPEELFQTGSEIASFDYGYSHTPQKVLSFHSEDATGRYVGFAFYAPGARETGWATTFCGRVNVAELAVYAIKAAKSPVTQLTAENVDKLTALGDNLLQGAERLTGSLAQGSGGWNNLSDGVIYKITTQDSAYASAKYGINVDTSDKKNPVTGEDIAGISGWGKVAFKLTGKVTLTHVLMAGSGGDQGDNRYVRYYEFYASDTQDDLFDAANRIVCYDNTNDPQLAQIHKLEQAVTCRYVGVRVTGEQYSQARISEFGFYGKTVSPVTQLTADNVDTLTALGDNLLQGAERLAGTLAQGSGGWSNLSDGVIYKITTQDSAYANAKCGVNVDTSDKKNPVTGEDIAGISGWGKASFKLAGEASVTHVLMAGSGSDWGDNRYVRYYEFYASRSEDDLFNISNRILCYDNYTSPQLAQIHELADAVVCRYIGVRVTGEQHTQARISEIGLYGSIKLPTVLPYTGLQTQTALEEALTGKGENLLEGAQVDNKTHDYLDVVGLNITSGKEALLTDGYINWTAEDTEEKVQAKPLASGAANQFYYDLRGTVRFSHVLVASSGKDQAVHRPEKITLYVSDDPDILFTEDSLIGMVQTGGSSTAALIDLSGVTAAGRYIGFAIPCDSQYGVLRLTELGVYGTYTTAVEPLPLNLLGQESAKLVDMFQMAARGFDNKTAVGANGAAGTNNNTGAISSKTNVNDFENTGNLTDGDWSTRGIVAVDSHSVPLNESYLRYDQNWAAFCYYLGGASRLDTVSLVSSNEPDYYVTGIQVYASYYYADLFKNESLLYTTGGEHYVGNEDDGYLPDYDYEVYQREIAYELTEEQKAQEYRYVAYVVTRAFPLYKPGTNQLQVGYFRARVAELTACGEVMVPEAPLNSSWTVSTSLGEATVMVKPRNYDDTAFFNAIARVTIDEESLPAGVSRQVSNNLLSVVGDKVYHLRFWDAGGKQINDPDNDRDIMVVFHIPFENNWYGGIIKNGAIERLYNAYVRPDNTIRMGENDYPVYSDAMKNNRDKATYQDMDAKLVLLQWNDPRTADALNGNRHHDYVDEVFGTAVAGAAEEDSTVSPLWFVLPVVPVAAVLTGMWLLRRRKHGEARR